MNVIADFLVRLGYDLDQKSQKDAEKSVDKLGDLVDGLSEKLDALKGTFAGVAAVWAGSKIISYVTETADKFDALGNAAKRIGAESPADLASLQYAFSQVGVEVDTLNDGLSSLTDYIGQAKLGEGEGLEVFKALGIDIKDANGNARDTLSVFDELTEKLSTLDHATQITYINMLGLDSELIQGMSKSREELTALREEYLAAYAGAGVSIDDTVKKSQEFNASLRKLKQSFSIVTDAVGTRFLGTATATFEQLRKYLTENISKLTLILSTVVKIIGSIAKAVIALGTVVFNVVSKIIDWWVETSDVFKTIVKLIGAATAAVLLLNSAFMKSPLGRLISLVTLVGLLIDDFKTWKAGGNSLIGEFIGGFSEVYGALDALPPALSFISDAFKAILPNLDSVLIGVAALPVAFKVVGKAVPLLTGPFLTFSKVAGGAISLVTKAVTALGLVLSKTVLGAAGLLGKLVSGAAALAKVLGVLTLSVVKLGAAFLATPIGWITAGIAAVIAVGVLLWKNWDSITAFLKAAWASVTEAFSGGVEYLKGIFDSLGAFIAGIPELLIAPWESLFSWLSDKFSWFSDSVNAIKNGAAKVVGWFTGDEDDEDSAAAASNPGKVTGRPLPISADSPTRTSLASNAVSERLRTPLNFTPSTLALPTLPPLSLEAERAANNTVSNLAIPAAAPLTPPAAPAAPTTVTQNNTGDTNIIIQAATNPQETAEAVAAQQQSVRSDAVRNLRRNFS